MGQKINFINCLILLCQINLKTNEKENLAADARRWREF